jgi:hypothetical protein
MDTVPPGLAAQLRETADAQGWLPPWPQWWGEEALAGLLPDPKVRRRFAAGCPRLPLAMFEEIHPRHRSGPMRPPRTCRSARHTPIRPPRHGDVAGR